MLIDKKCKALFMVASVAMNLGIIGNLHGSNGRPTYTDLGGRTMIDASGIALQANRCKHPITGISGPRIEYKYNNGSSGCNNSSVCLNQNTQKADPHLDTEGCRREVFRNLQLDGLRFLQIYLEYLETNDLDSALKKCYYQIEPGFYREPYNPKKYGEDKPIRDMVENMIGILWQFERPNKPEVQVIHDFVRKKLVPCLRSIDKWIDLNSKSELDAALEKAESLGLCKHDLSIFSYQIGE